MVEPYRPQMKHRMTHALCMLHNSGYKHTHLILIALLLQQRLHEGASVLRHAYTACLVVCLVLKITVDNTFTGTHRAFIATAKENYL